MKIFDAHCDLWEDVDEKRNRGLKNIINDLHKPKWDEGNICGGIYPIWIFIGLEEDYFSQSVHIIKNMAKEINEASDIVHIVKDFDDINKAATLKKHAMILGAEGLSFIGSNPELLYTYYLAGLRSISLTWNEDNPLACGSSTNNDTGLSELGKRAIEIMNELGIIVDLAHSSSKTFDDICNIMDKPFIVSHGNCSALCSHGRNYTDQQIMQIAKHNGVIGISAYGPMIADSSSDWTIDKMADHIDHVIKIAGIDHVGLGFDLVDFLDDFGIDPSITTITKGLENISKSQNLVKTLRSRGYTELELEKICYRNFYRVIKAILE